MTYMINIAEYCRNYNHNLLWTKLSFTDRNNRPPYTHHEVQRVGRLPGCGAAELFARRHQALHLVAVGDPRPGELRPQQPVKLRGGPTFGIIRGSCPCPKQVGGYAPWRPQSMR